MSKKTETEVLIDVKQVSTRLDGVVIGVLMAVGNEGAPEVIFAGNQRDKAIAARSTVQLSADDVGAEVALMFEDGDPARPIVMGRLLRPESVQPRVDSRASAPESDRLVLSARDEIVLTCGKASVTLTRAGKILLRGAYIFSRSTGVNKIKGGSVQLN